MISIETLIWFDKYGHWVLTAIFIAIYEIWRYNKKKEKEREQEKFKREVAKEVAKEIEKKLENKEAKDINKNDIYKKNKEQEKSKFISPYMSKNNYNKRK